MNDERAAGARGTTPSRAALLALVIGAAIPFLPVFGDGNDFIFSIGFPTRVVVAYLLAQWSTAIAVALGLIVLRRGRRSLAAGVFGAAGMIVGIGLVARVIEFTDAFTRWQSALVLALWSIETALLAVAALTAERTPETGRTPSP